METKPTQRDRDTEKRITKLEFTVRELEIERDNLLDEFKMLKEHVLRLGLPSAAPKP